MWLSERVSGERREKPCGCSVGVVTIGGDKPCVFTQGEIRSAELVSQGCLSLPRVGDEVVVLHSDEGDHAIVGKIEKNLPQMAEEDEVYITTAGGRIQIKKNGEICIEGAKLLLKGSTEILGSLKINGVAYSPAGKGA